MKIIITLLILASVSFAQAQESSKSKEVAKKISAEEKFKSVDPSLKENPEMSRVKTIESDCPNCNHQSLLANNHLCLVNQNCAHGHSPTSGKSDTKDGVK